MNEEIARQAFALLYRWSEMAARLGIRYGGRGAWFLMAKAIEALRGMGDGTTETIAENITLEDFQNQVKKEGGEFNILSDRIPDFEDVAQKYDVNYNIADMGNNLSLVTFDADSYDTMLNCFSEYVANSLGVSMEDVAKMSDNEIQCGVLGLDPEKFDVSKMTQEELENALASAYLADKCGVAEDVFRNPENAEQAYEALARLTGKSVDDVRQWTPDEMMENVKNAPTKSIIQRQMDDVDLENLAERLEKAGKKIDGKKIEVTDLKKMSKDAIDGLKKGLEQGEKAGREIVSH